MLCIFGDIYKIYEVNDDNLGRANTDLIVGENRRD